MYGVAKGENDAILSILPNKILNDKKGDQQPRGLNPLLKLNPIITHYNGLKKAILDIEI